MRARPSSKGRASAATWRPDIWFSSRYGALQAVPFDLDRLETTGDAVRVEEGVRMNSFGDQRAHFEISDAGTLVFRHDSMSY